MLQRLSLREGERREHRSINEEVSLADLNILYSKNANSARRKPQPNRIPIIAKSRLLRRVAPSDFSSNNCHCSRLSLLWNLHFCPGRLAKMWGALDENNWTKVPKNAVPKGRGLCRMSLRQSDCVGSFRLIRQTLPTKANDSLRDRDTHDLTGPGGGCAPVGDIQISIRSKCHPCWHGEAGCDVFYVSCPIEPDHFA
jgi:ribosomal protein L31